jgi:putative ABC transport system permease protein
MAKLSWIRRLGLWLGRDRATRELEDEMRLHRELRAAVLERSGATAPKAWSAAQRRFGNAAALQQESRDVWGFTASEELRQDVRYAVRRLRQRPAFTASVIVVLTLGIGTTAAMFSAIDAAMLRPLPFTRPQQLVRVRSVEIPFDPGPGQPAYPGTHSLQLPDLVAMPEFRDVAAYAAGGLNLSDPDRPVHIKVGVVTASFFRTLGIVPPVGRGFDSIEGRPGGNDVAVLSDALWRNQFGGRPLVNHVIRLNDKPFTVVGVAPPGFSFPDQSDLWIPMTVPETFATFEPFRGFLSETVIARTAPGISPARAAARVLAAWHQGLIAESDSFRHANIKSMIADVARDGAVTPLQQDLLGTHRDALLMLLGATLCLLLIACANVTNLLLAQAVARRREVALRAVLGAGRGRIVRQLLAESVILSLAGAGAGLILAPGLLQLLKAILPAHLSSVAPARIDGRVLAAAVAASLVTGVMFGLWPASTAAQAAPAEAIKAGTGHGSTAAGGSRVRQVLVIAEVALTLILLIDAGLMLRSFQRLMHQDRGIDTDHVGSLELSFSDGNGGGTSRVPMMERLLARLAAVPGIQSAGIINNLPLSGAGGIGLEVEVPGIPPLSDDNDNRWARNVAASSGWFTVLGVQFVRGRNFLASEESAGSRAAIINQTVADAYWPHADPVGRTFAYNP